MDEVVLGILRKEFYGRFTEAEYQEAMQSDLRFSSTDIRAGNSTKATDMFVVRDNQSIVGILVLKYFAWELIAPQLYFECVTEAGKSIGIRLRPLKTLISFTTHETKFVGELSYFWVDQAMRGKGLGSFLFNQSIAQFHSILSVSDIAMTLSLGNQVSTGIGGKLKKAILELEESVNGIDEESGLIKVKGEVMYADRVRADFGLHLSDILSSERSKATEVLAIKHAMQFLGYSSNLSLLFATNVHSLQ